MANILITGANGFIGSRLAATMPVGSAVRLNGKDEVVERLVLVDHVVTDSVAGPDGAEWAEGDLGALVAAQPDLFSSCLLYTSPSPRDLARSRMPSSA